MLVCAQGFLLVVLGRPHELLGTELGQLCAGPVPSPPCFLSGPLTAMSVGLVPVQCLFVELFGSLGRLLTRNCPAGLPCESSHCARDLADHGALSGPLSVSWLWEAPALPQERVLGAQSVRASSLPWPCKAVPALCFPAWEKSCCGAPGKVRVPPSSQSPCWALTSR